MARPFRRTPELRKAILDRVIAGEYIAQICRDEDMPSSRSVFHWLAEDEEFQAEYTLAKKFQADAIEDEIAGTEHKLLEGRLDANTARVMLLSMQWRAARLNPRKYGDKTMLSNSSGDGAPQVNVYLPDNGRDKGGK